MLEQITSLSNNTIKEVLKLRKTKTRREKKLIIVDGLREIQEAYNNEFKIEKIFICPKLIKKNYQFKNIRKIELTEKVFKKIAYPNNPDGWLALIKPKEYKFSNLKISNNPIVFILEGLEKPGNLGAIIRTASAIKADAIIINEKNTDLYNANVIKASTGLIFDRKIIISEKEKTLNWLKENNFKIWATTGKAKKNIFTSNFKKSTAFVFGCEAFGLSSFWLDKADELVKIPINNKVDSLNVSVSVAIFAFETIRQRQF